MKNIGFIGGGRIVRIFLQGWKNANTMPSNISVFEPDSIVAKDLKKSFENINLVSELANAAAADIVFLALHPPVIKEKFIEISEIVNSDSIVISLAPKIDMAKMIEVLPGKKVLRMIPNATSYVNKGFNPLCFSKDVSIEEKENILSMMKPLGETVEVPEKDLEGYAIISAMLPTYFWPQWKTLVELGEKMGLEPEAARESIKETLHASVDLMLDSGFDYEFVSDLIPLKPLAKVEDEINQIIAEQLFALYQKIKP
jgi:pyrroline-5-carboxylate reductase